MTAQDLKNSILQLAVQGKLVEQREEEGTARELLEQIRAEKEQLIKEKKIKKEKPLPEITEEEKPFEIPKSWEWVRFSDVMDIRDGTHDSPKYYEEGIPLVTSKNISGGGLDFSNVKYVSQEDAKKINERSNVDTGDILFAMIGSIGNPVIVNKDREFCVKNVALFKNYTKICLDIKFVYWFLFREQYTLKKIASGGVQSFISLKVFRNYLFPLPPLAEQNRIVAKIEEILPYIEQYDKAYTKLEMFNKKFPSDMKKSLLQLAMQGKLVEQRAEEGTAEELYQQIVAEKSRLIKEGRIKKEKPLAEIIDEEIPFEIPESWKWVRIGEIGSLTRGSGIKRTETIESGFPCIRYGELYTTYKIKFTNTVSFVDKGIYDKSKKIVKNDVVMALTGENKTDIAMAVAYKGDDEIAMGGDMTCWSHHIMEPLFLVYLMNSPYGISCKKRLATGDIIVHISNDKLASIPIPLPPLAEQKRIVAKLEQLLPYCEQLIK